MSLLEWFFNLFSLKSKPKPIIVEDQPVNVVPENVPPTVVIEGTGQFIPLPKEPHRLTESEIRQGLYDSMVINENIVDLKGRILIENVPAKVKAKVDKIFLSQQRYINIANKFANPIKWYHISFLHEMECTQNFNCYLGNGQPINKKTTIVPIGRGPFSTFELGAIDAIKLNGLDQIQDWSIGNTLYILEGFNGYGYSRYKGINSPYLFSGSNQYISGKYVSDGARGYDPNAVSQQIGIALLMKELLSRL
jgi:lysozyme family protein